MMVKRRYKPEEALRLIRTMARDHDVTVHEQKGRGKGSHRRFRILDEEGHEVARFGLVSHAGDMSWTVTRSLEEALEGVFGEGWMSE
jgi:hypothetical protein